MLKILETPALLKKRDELREEFNIRKSDILRMESLFAIIDKVDEWKYATGAIYDQPPYGMEMQGSSSGRALKKKYASPHEARLLGKYSSGFISGVGADRKLTHL